MGDRYLPERFHPHVVDLDAVVANDEADVRDAVHAEDGFVSVELQSHPLAQGQYGLEEFAEVIFVRSC